MSVRQSLAGLFVLAITTAALAGGALAGGVPAGGKLPDRWSTYIHKHKDGSTEGLIFADFGIPWIIEGDRLSLPKVEGKKLLAGAQGEVFTYKLLPAEGGGSARIELTPLAGPNKGKVHNGIFELKDRELRICFSPPGQDRPAAFDLGAKSDQVLVVLRR